MHSTALLALGLASLASAWPTLPSFLQSRQATCVSGTAVYIISARGSTQAVGEGSLSQVSTLIKNSLPGSVSVGLDYPATLDNYESSENTGVVNLKKAITAYATSCPSSKIVLLGYSQGGQVIGDALGGASFSSEAPLSSTYTKNIVATVSFASPAHVAGKSYNSGTSTRSGIYKRSVTTTLDTYSARLLDICDSNDLFCDSGSSLSPHTGVVQKYAQAGATYAINKAKA
ncbi:cutinase [Pseudovirgaria hyperparasitica]|uniref:Cutinase n=1 Tax=Pseudovirgaria hyperparasitica TaxID=470096 RepID=A0A6A6VXA0_9PEZI|nr:cutinase [Pseudovirgaria hyperparasitica]KAF2755232.1 cutinase [Pseudovirgaria hyperparasitica]